MHVWTIEISDFLPGVDADQRILRCGMLARALAARGHDVLWWTSTFSHHLLRHRFHESTSRELQPGITARLLHGPGYSHRRSAARIRHNRRVAREFANEAYDRAAARRPDAIVAFLPTLEVSEQAVRLAAREGIPVIIDVRDRWPDVYLTHFPRRVRPLARLALAAEYRRASKLLAGATALTGVSDMNVTWAAALARRPRAALDQSFPLGYPRSASATAAAALEMRSALGIPAERFVCAFVGIFTATYDLDALVDAARALSARAPQVHFVLVGSGEREAALRQRARGLSNVTFAGWRTAEELRAILATADAGLVAYGRDAINTLPNKPFEYMAAGLPLISSLPGELAEIVESERIGRQYAAGDADALAECILDLASNRENARAIGRRARALFERRFSSEEIYARFAEHVEHVAATRVIGEIESGRHHVAHHMLSR